jgi:SAM-dependent methyltransferase
MADHHISPPAAWNISALDFNEPLAESAMLALQWSNTRCNDCASYHGAWQILRLLGVLNSMRSDDDFLFRQLDTAIGKGARRILISGAADYALQARIAAVARRHRATPQITVVDRCETPLELNRWYAVRTGMDTRLLSTDILKYRNPDRFDLVCTHSFLCFFAPDDRKKLARIWWDCLAPGGAVLTAQRIRPDETSALHGFSDAQTEAMGERAYRLADEQYDLLGIEPAHARSLAVNYAATRSTHTIRDSEQLSMLFSQQGFELEHFAPPGKQQPEKDIPSTPAASGHHRWRILARKPAVQNIL